MIKYSNKYLDKRDGRWFRFFWREDGQKHRTQESRLLWEQANGPIPEGRQIHHIDANPSNDDLDNLQCLTPSEHAIAHAHLQGIYRFNSKGQEERRCADCGEHKTLDRFYEAKPIDARVYPYCKRCKTLYMRELRRRKKRELLAATA